MYLTERSAGRLMSRCRQRRSAVSHRRCECTTCNAFGMPAFAVVLWPKPCDRREGCGSPLYEAPRKSGCKSRIVKAGWYVSLGSFKAITSPSLCRSGSFQAKKSSSVEPLASSPRPSSPKRTAPASRKRQSTVSETLKGSRYLVLPRPNIQYRRFIKLKPPSGSLFAMLHRPFVLSGGSPSPYVDRKKTQSWSCPRAARCL